MTKSGSPTDIRIGWAPPMPAEPVHHVEKCMGTVFSFHIAAPGVDQAALSSVLAWLHDMDALFSPYRADSQVSRINAGQLHVTDADPDVRRALVACERYRVVTDGYFDARADGHRLDPCGYVKGWAIQTASDMLAAAGSADHCVNGGGDIACIGRPAEDRQWRIGIADPHRRDTIVRMVIADGPTAVATSGLAERGAHILDPHTGQPAVELASASVVTPDLVTADVYATAAVAMGLERATTWLQRQPATTATLVTADGTIVDVTSSTRLPCNAPNFGPTGSTSVALPSV